MSCSPNVYCRKQRHHHRLNRRLRKTPRLHATRSPHHRIPPANLTRSVPDRVHRVHLRLLRQRRLQSNRRVDRHQQTRHASSRNSDAVTITVGDESLSNYLRATGLGKTLKYEYVQSFQSALYAPKSLVLLNARKPKELSETSVGSWLTGRSLSPIQKPRLKNCW